VCPATRASIADPLQFSINMWEQNVELWRGKETTIQGARDLHFLTKLGFSKNDTLHDVSTHYCDFLKSLQAFG
jgi:hypothetical protein